MRVFCCFVLMTLALVANAEALRVIYPKPQSATDERHRFRVAALQLALEKTRPTDGDFELLLSDDVLSQARIVESLQHGKIIDVVALPATQARTRQLLPIPIPLLKGLLGYRLLLINAKDQPRFSQVETLDDLSRFRAGLSFDWADKAIYAHNGLPMVDGASYEGLFGMLAGKRFDYFPRGINEIWKEWEIYHGRYPTLQIEQNLALHYRFEVYFFTHRQNAKLADRIERGLKLAMKDGSFDRLFRRYHQDFYQKARLDQRRIIEMENPDRSMRETTHWDGTTFPSIAEGEWLAPRHP